MGKVELKSEKEIKIKEFLNPRYVFVPIKDGFKLRVKDNEYVYKNDIVAIDKKGNTVNSSVSGKVLGVKDMDYSYGSLPSVVIENDFKENIRVRKSARKFLSNITKKEVLSILKDTRASTKDGYLYEMLNRSVDTLVVNAIDIEPVFQNRYYALKENYENILEASDIIASIMDSKKIILAIKSRDSEIINSLMNIIGTYPNIEIKLLDDAYPIGMNTILLKNLGLKEALVLDTSIVKDIYDILKRVIPISEKFISIVGEGVNESALIKVKIGSLLSEVFISNFDFTSKTIEVYLNGPYHGEKVDTMKYVIDESIDGVYITDKPSKEPKACINCGLCSKSCPMGLNPKYVFDHRGNVRSEYKTGCIQCGLCRGVCPSNRDLKKYMKE